MHSFKSFCYTHQRNQRLVDSCHSLSKVLTNIVTTMFNKRQNATITAITRSLRFAPEGKRRNLSCFTNSWHQHADYILTKQISVSPISSHIIRHRSQPFHSGMNRSPRFQREKDDLQCMRHKTVREQRIQRKARKLKCVLTSPPKMTKWHQQRSHSAILYNILAYEILELYMSGTPSCKNIHYHIWKPHGTVKSAACYI